MEFLSWYSGFLGQYKDCLTSVRIIELVTIAPVKCFANCCREKTHIKDWSEVKHEEIKHNGHVLFEQGLNESPWSMVPSKISPNYASAEAGRGLRGVRTSISSRIFKVNAVRLQF